MRCSLEDTERYQTEQVLIKWIMAPYELLVEVNSNKERLWRLCIYSVRIIEGILLKSKNKAHRLLDKVLKQISFFG